MGIKSKKNFFISIGIFMCFSIVYGTTINFPLLGYPEGKTEGGKIKFVLDNIKRQTCNFSTQYIQGFDENGNHICKDLSSFKSLSIGDATSSPVTNNEGKFVKYLGNILSMNCGDGKYLQGFNINTKQLICIDKNGVTYEIGADLSHIPIPFSVTKPGYSPGEIDGNYTQKYFNKIFGACTNNQYLKGYDENGIICENIVSGACGTAIASIFTSYPTSNLCEKGVAIVSDNIGDDGTYNWKCISDLGNDVECSAGKKINGGWSAWGSCNASCGIGTQYRFCNNPTPVNGGSECIGVNSQSCSITALNLSQEYTIPGNYTYIVPNGVTQLKISGCGGGGGGSSTPSGKRGKQKSWAGSGGAGADTILNQTLCVVPGESLNIVIGKGGNGGVYNSTGDGIGYNGESGGNSTIKNIILQGGGGGIINGTAYPQSLIGVTDGQIQSGGSGPNGYGSTNGPGGKGGNSYYGGGGAGGRYGGGGNGNKCAGGGGGDEAEYPGNGGSGGNGYIKISW